MPCLTQFSEQTYASLKKLSITYDSSFEKEKLEQSTWNNVTTG